jgi:hypothetical protein
MYLRRVCLALKSMAQHVGDLIMTSSRCMYVSCQPGRLDTDKSTSLNGKTCRLHLVVSRSFSIMIIYLKQFLDSTAALV